MSEVPDQTRDRWAGLREWAETEWSNAGTGRAALDVLALLDERDELERERNHALMRIAELTRAEVERDQAVALLREHDKWPNGPSPGWVRVDTRAFLAALSDEENL